MAIVLIRFLPWYLDRIDLSVRLDYQIGLTVLLRRFNRILYPNFHALKRDLNIVSSCSISYGEDGRHKLKNVGHKEKST